jgi:hypothetical protein
MLWVRTCLNADPDAAFWWPQLNNLQLEKILFLDIKNANFLSLGLGTSKLQEKPSALKREHPALQNMKFILLFLFLRVLIAFLDQNTVDQNKGKSMRSWIHNIGYRHIFIVLTWISGIF